jgi:hypothetical protein
MSRLEDRLRGAYRHEAGLVTSASIRDLEAAITAQAERSAGPGRPGRPQRTRRPRRWGRWLAPLAAAAAVAVIVVVAVAVRHHTSPGPAQAPKPSGPAARPATPKFLIDDPTGESPLLVRNATTGAVVARVTVPPGYPGRGTRTYITAVATQNGRNYLVAEYANPCRSWIYQFQLSGAGQPSRLTPFAALPTVPSSLDDLAVSGNGEMVGFTTAACMGAKAQPDYLGVINTRTGRTTRWTAPSGVNDVSLTQDGQQLSYSVQGAPYPQNSSVVRVIPTSSGPGPADSVGQTVARAPSGQYVSYSVISPDNRTVYYVTFQQQGQKKAFTPVGQVRVLDLATGRSHVIYAAAVLPGEITSDPAVRYLQMQIQGQANQAPQLPRLDLATGKVTYLPNAHVELSPWLFW